MFRMKTVVCYGDRQYNFDALIVQGKRGVSNHTQMCVTQSKRPEENEKIMKLDSKIGTKILFY